MPSISFDRVAHAYDATRGYPEDVAQQVAKAIVATVDATAETAFIEVGVGTGRMAFPQVSLGCHYTGVDISTKMVEQLVAKLRSGGWQEQSEPWGTRADEKPASPSEVQRFVQPGTQATMRLVMGDMTQLPFFDASFAVAIAVHVFHLVDGWQEAVSEVLRVVRPGGYFLHCWDAKTTPGGRNVHRQWEQIVKELGSVVKRPGTTRAHLDVAQFLREQGLQPEERSVVEWETEHSTRKALEDITKRLWSGTWSVPDDLFAASIERLEPWAKQQFGPNEDVEYTEMHHFMICKTRV